LSLLKLKRIARPKMIDTAGTLARSPSHTTRLAERGDRDRGAEQQTSGADVVATLCGNANTSSHSSTTTAIAPRTSHCTEAGMSW
jgi:hypothetical protein